MRAQEREAAGRGLMADPGSKPRRQGGAALAALALFSLLLAAAGLLDLLGWVEVELRFFDRAVTSRRGHLLWIGAFLGAAGLFGLLFGLRSRRG